MNTRVLAKGNGTFSFGYTLFWSSFLTSKAILRIDMMLNQKQSSVECYMLSGLMHSEREKQMLASVSLFFRKLL